MQCDVTVRYSRKIFSRLFLAGAPSTILLSQGHSGNYQLSYLIISPMLYLAVTLKLFELRKCSFVYNKMDLILKMTLIFTGDKEPEAILIFIKTQK
jgi:hypothetical protein